MGGILHGLLDKFFREISLRVGMVYLGACFLKHRQTAFVVELYPHSLQNLEGRRVYALEFVV